MDKKTLQSGIYEAKVTLYKTGNMHITITNRINGEVKNVKCTRPGIVNLRKRKENEIKSQQYIS